MSDKSAAIFSNNVISNYDSAKFGTKKDAATGITFDAALATAQTQSSAPDTNLAPAKGNAAADKFMKFMDDAKSTPGGFYRAQILASKGLTEDDVAAMSQEEREKLEAEIEAEIKEKFAEAVEARKAEQGQVAL